MARHEIEYLGKADIDAIALTDEEILAAIEQGLIAAGQGKTVIEPRMHLTPDPAFNGHFNVLRGYVEPLGYAGVKIVGDYVDNYKQGLPSELALLNLFDPRTGMPKAVIDAAGITDMRTGALTALGAKWLAPKNPRVLGHVGARGTAYWNVRLLDHLFDFEEIRVHSRRKESRDAFGEKLSRDLGKKVIVTEDWGTCLKDADIMIEATRLNEPTPMFQRSWVKPGTLVVPYGTMSSLPLDFTDGFDKFVMDDLGQMRAGSLGALRPQINAGKITEESFYAEIGEIAAGLKPGRESDEETILFWHRGMSTGDIALGAAILEKARKMGVTQNLLYRED
jgi:ornithine cyclodeaminase/alanine dehydrogenase-like protein (mu-crystallin family)